jgi:NADH-quinone oxidoreductase subunit L
MVMILPMAVLGVGAVIAGYVGYEAFVGEAAHQFWGSSIMILPDHRALEEAHHVPTWVKVLPLAVGVFGIAAAFVLYQLRTDLPERLAGRFRGLYLFLLNKWYFDELYDAVFVRPVFAVGRGLWKGGDGAVIDGVGPDGVAAAAVNLARRAVRLQSGYVYHYAFSMLAGVVILITGYLLTAG